MRLAIDTLATDCIASEGFLDNSFFEQKRGV
jgi:hypothetical protein